MPAAPPPPPFESEGCITRFDGHIGNENSNLSKFSVTQPNRKCGLVQKKMCHGGGGGAI